jgi:hypothetical protein
MRLHQLFYWVRFVAVATLSAALTVVALNTVSAKAADNVTSKKLSGTYRCESDANKCG